MAVRPTVSAGVGTNQCGGEVIPDGATVRCFAFSDLDLDFPPLGEMSVIPMCKCGFPAAVRVYCGYPSATTQHHYLGCSLPYISCRSFMWCKVKLPTAEDLDIQDELVLKAVQLEDDISRLEAQVAELEALLICQGANVSHVSGY
ncbi:hypothetical protein LINGRAHAP2_LOCUS8146 [Linum grandiflorum]